VKGMERWLGCQAGHHSHHNPRKSQFFLQWCKARAGLTWQCCTSSDSTRITDCGPPLAPKRSSSSSASRAACKQVETQGSKSSTMLPICKDSHPMPAPVCNTLPKFKPRCGCRAPLSKYDTSSKPQVARRQQGPGHFWHTPQLISHSQFRQNSDKMGTVLSQHTRRKVFLPRNPSLHGALSLNSSACPAFPAKKQHWATGAPQHPPSTSPQLTLAMPTELAFNSVMPWFVLSPRSHIPKSCAEASAHWSRQRFTAHPENLQIPPISSPPSRCHGTVPSKTQEGPTAAPIHQPTTCTLGAHSPSPAWATHRSFVGCFNVEHEVLDKVDFIQAVNYVEA